MLRDPLEVQAVSSKDVRKKRIFSFDQLVYINLEHWFELDDFVGCPVLELLCEQI